MWFFPYRGSPNGRRNRRIQALKTGGFRANWLREFPPSAKVGHEGLYPGKYSEPRCADRRPRNGPVSA